MVNIDMGADQTSQYWTFNPRHLLWFAVPIGIFFFSLFLENQFAHNGEVFTYRPGIKDDLYHEIPSRIFVFTTGLLLFLTTMAVSVICLAGVYRRVGPKQFLWFLAPLIALWLMGAFVHFFGKGFNTFGTVLGMDDSFFISVLKHSTISVSGESRTLWALYQFIYGGSTIALGLGMWTTVSAALSCTARPPDIAEVKSGPLAGKNPYELLDFYLLLTGILLVIGMIHSIALSKWPAFLLHDQPTELALFMKIADGMAIYNGLTWSAMIGSIYLIALALVRLNFDAKTFKESGGFLRKMGVTDIQKSVISQTLKIVSPILVAWLSTAIEFGG